VAVRLLPAITLAALFVVIRTYAGDPLSVAQSDTLRGSWFQVIGTDDGASFDLYVGQIDAPEGERPPAFRAVSGAPEWIRGSGPVHGIVAAWWHEGGSTRAMTFDTSDGSGRPLTDAAGDPLPSEGQRLLAASLDPSGESWYFVGAADDGTPDGLWRAPLPGGSPERVGGPWAGGGPYLTWSVDGSMLVAWGRVEAGVEYRLYDTGSGEFRQLDVPPMGDVVGFLDSGLIVYADPDAHRELHLPLVRIDVKELAVTEIAAGPGIFAETFPGPDGEVLVHDGPGPNDGYTLTALDAPFAEPRTIFAGDPPWYDPLSLMVRDTEEAHVELPGWVPVFPRQAAFLPPGVNGADEQRIVVSIADGKVVEVPIPEVREP
jgi:hypothetical protein